MRTEELSDVSGLLGRAADGDAEALRALFAEHRERLKRIVRLRLNRSLQGCLKDSDVVQEACDEAARQLTDYLQAPSLPFFLWLRHLTCMQVGRVHGERPSEATSAI